MLAYTITSFDFAADAASVVTNVYAPSTKLRLDFVAELRVVAGMCALPWIFVGAFNMVPLRQELAPVRLCRGCRLQPRGRRPHPL